MNDKWWCRLLVGGVAVYVVLWIAFYIALVYIAVHFLGKVW